MTRGGGVCVFSERLDVGYELLSIGRRLADRTALVSIVCGPEADEAAKQHVARGADRVLIGAAPAGSDPTERYLAALRQAVQQVQPSAVLIGATRCGNELAARLAQRLGVACATECTGLELREGVLAIERLRYGRFVSRQRFTTRPAVATIQARRFEIPEPQPDRAGAIELLAIEPHRSRVRVIRTESREPSRFRLDQAEVIVAVGRGLRKKEDLTMIDRLAAALGGVVAASRPLTDDLQWLPGDLKVGLSGATVRPRLYIACGISGQIEHNVGMRESGVVVAINTDPQAPILQQADYCITGDLYQLVPALTQAVNLIRGQVI
ncbi:MAG TPA: electron transfer flavoprotein subunit alpha/FixB family protein [Acidobacteriota bacterium]